MHVRSASADLVVYVRSFSSCDMANRKIRFLSFRGLEAPTLDHVSLSLSLLSSLTSPVMMGLAAIVSSCDAKFSLAS